MSSSPFPNKTHFYLIEELTLWGWFFQLMPRCLKSKPSHVYCLEAPRWVLWLAQRLGALGGIKVERLEFKLLEVRDNDGTLTRFRVEHQDFPQLLLKIQERYLKTLISNSNGKIPMRLPTYLFRTLAVESIHGRQTLSHLVLLIQLLCWKTRGLPETQKTLTLLLRPRSWLSPIRDYASSRGVAVFLTGGSATRSWRKPWMVWVHRKLKNWFWRLRHPSTRFETDASSKIVVECHYHVNLDHREMFSELFFWQQSDLPGRDFVVTFHIPQEPLDGPKMSELARHGMMPLPLRAEVTQISQCPPFDPKLLSLFRKKYFDGKNPFTTPLESRWFRTQLKQYQTLRNFWSQLLDRYDGKIFVSWYKYGPEHCAIADALAERGGVTALYQRALEMNPAGCTAVDVDLYFGFSRFAAEMEQRSGSKIPYFIVTGYLGDHRFPLLMDKARAVRAGLEKQGAKQIMAFTDEHSHDDERWLLGHTITRANYTFLLEKVLQETWFGLVLKPKKPSTLSQRLGPVAELLRAAIATGRCYLFQEGECHSSYPPAVAALASDIAVHGHLYGPTAALESALAGKPSLMMDKEGWKLSPFYQLKADVVFNDWPSLWEACLDEWKYPGRKTRLGDWSEFIETFDPFRDGQAAKRMGTFLQGLLRDLQAGLNREEALGRAAERYGQEWGKEKVIANAL